LQIIQRIGLQGIYQPITRVCPKPTKTEKFSNHNHSLLKQHQENQQQNTQLATTNPVPNLAINQNFQYPKPNHHQHFQNPPQTNPRTSTQTKTEQWQETTKTEAKRPKEKQYPIGKTQLNRCKSKLKFVLYKQWVMQKYKEKLGIIPS